MKLLSASAVVALLLLSDTASSQDAKHACVTSAYEGQRLRDAGDLAAARAVLLKCVATECPALVVSDCSTWLAQVDARLPTVVLAAHDASGHDLLHIRVALDGKPIATALDGTSIALNPGPHTFSFEGESGAVGEASIIAREGEKNRIVSTTLNPPADTGRAPATSSVPLATFILGGVGIAALGSFAAFGIVGQNEKNTLSRTCAPTGSCTSADVDSAQTKLILADVSLGVGVVAIASASYLWIARVMGAKRAAPPVGVAPTAHGVTGVLSGTF
jgi:hypothetical protein